MWPGSLPRKRPWDLSPRGTANYWRRLRSEQLLIGSFIALILVGTVGLRLIPHMYAPGVTRLSWLDSLFTITSAVCVTGLSVVDTATYFSFWGQLWILLFIQLGGLGMIVLSSFIILALGGRLSLRIESLNTGSLDVAPRLNRGKLVRDMILFTLIAEWIGSVLLYILWHDPNEPFAETAWHAVFHSVSAFCNAGFSTYSTNYIGQAGANGVLIVTAMLIIAGGIGFLSMEELFRRLRPPPGAAAMKLSIHTRLVLSTTAFLIVIGTAVYALLEWSNPHTLGTESMSGWNRLTNSFFMSVTARTAGFNAIDYANAHASTNFFTILLMGIGGSPGSTAGGVKTTTIAIIGLLAWNRLRGSPIVSIWGRTLPEETIQRAVGLLVFIFALTTFFTLLLTAVENQRSGKELFLPYMFEAVSAFNTVGLTMNMTMELTPVGKWIDIVLMFLGRVGPLTFAAAVALPEGAGDRSFRYAKEDVVIG